MVKSETLLRHQELERLYAFIKKEFGISFDEEKRQRFAKKIKTLMQKYAIEDFNVFYHKIRYKKDDELLQELISVVTINETYFWRENEQFEIFVKDVLPNIAKTKHKIRILVAPTSSGEELYSIMFAILEENNVIKERDIEMVGIDIDANMIRKAKVGLYSRRSVDKLPKKFLEKYFKKVGNYYKIDDFFIKNAKFLQANIFDEALIEKVGCFDVVFSRNMLIYFDFEEKAKAYEVFLKLLIPNGYLFLGHADANGIDKNLFESVKSGFQIYKKR